MADQAYGRKPLDKIPENEAGLTFRDEDLSLMYARLWVELYRENSQSP